MSANLFKKLVPPLLPTFYKGQLSKILVFGGEYNGAVFFAADAALKTGADLVHVVCNKDVAQVIKSYTPDLMVHPYLDSTDTGLDRCFEKIGPILDKVDVLAIGSGLGRDDYILSAAKRAIQETMQRNKPIVMDADALFLLARDPGLINGYKKCIITPNAMEFKRIMQNFVPDFAPSKDPKNVTNAIKLSQYLGGVTVLQKGQYDIVATGTDVSINDTQSSLKRCGGQGDTLCGALSVFVAWSEKYKAHLWPHSDEIAEKDLYRNAAVAASTLVRTAAREAFDSKGRSMQASDMHGFLGSSFRKVFDDYN